MGAHDLSPDSGPLIDPGDGYGPLPSRTHVVAARMELYNVLGGLPGGPRLQRCLATALEWRADELHEIMGRIRDSVEGRSNHLNPNPEP